MEESLNISLQSWEKKLFADAKLMKVLESLTKSPKSMKIISDETGIPLPTVYTKMRTLKEKNLVFLELAKLSRVEERGFFTTFHD